ncbi:TRAP transporter small permease [Cereibacter azotoformans]|uniref:TRAP transporter small permease protein n=1 Tax=Cereibacter sphaeroides (strain ATCC 17025 / ATH 2.4.3) TaxID=349102 RepID=A4WXV9_CERS5|nr:TRAP transporter small permease subunit [Cereibacter azotoformans]ULB11677.1 TRAP transporter small permease [Cereibacter azotoformans]
MRLIFLAASAFGALSVAVLVIMTAVAVFARYILGMPIAWTEEVSGLLMIWIVMVGAIACEANRQHLTIDLIEGLLSRRMRRLLSMAVGLASVGLLVFMAWQAWALGQTTAFKKTQILGVSWFWLDLAVVVGAAGTAFVTAWRLVRPEAEAQPARDRSLH